MSETLLIHYNIEHPQQATWALCNDAGELTGKLSTGSLDELSKISANHTAVVLLNSQCLHINKLRLPTQNMQKMIKAVPYAIEEFIAEDIEDFHFVISKNKHDDTTSVVGIDKTTLKNIIEVFQGSNIVVEKIIPDVLCLTASSKQWTCLNFGQDTYLQTDTFDGMVLSHEVLPYVIKKRLQDETQVKPDKILLFSEQDNPSVFDELQIDDTDIEIINISYNTHPLVVFCGQYKQALALNLLQQKFKPKRKSSGQWQHWRLAASLAAVWLTLHLGVTGFQYSQLKDKNNVTKAKIEKIYKSAFPESRKIINPRSQMEQKLKELKGDSSSSGNGLIFLLAESFGTIDQDKENISLQSINFRNNKMELRLDSANLQAIETLNKELNNNKNIKAEITSSSSEKDKVRGNIQIEGRG